MKSVVSPIPWPRRIVAAVLLFSFRAVEALRIAKLSSDSRMGREAVDREAVLAELRGMAYDVSLAIERFFVRLRRFDSERLVEQGRSAPSYPPGTTLETSVASATGVSFVDGNETALRVRNEEDFRTRLELIDAAQRSITACFWTVKLEPTGETFVERISRRAEDGLRVTLAVCHNTVRRQIYINPRYRELLRRIERSNVDFHLLKHEDWNCDHRKMFAVDGEYALIGGRNIGDSYAIDGRADSFSDIDVWIHGRGAREVERTILGLVGLGDEAAGSLEVGEMGEDRIALVNHRASFEAIDRVILGLLAAVRGAERSIDLSFGYFMAPPVILEELVRARDRGVRVRVLTNSAATVDYPLWHAGGYAALAPLVEAGLPVYLMQARVLHSKFAVIDGELALVGSHNLWPLSSIHDCESVLLVSSRKLGADLTDRFETLLEDATQVDTLRVPSGLVPWLAKRVNWAWYAS